MLRCAVSSYHAMRRDAGVAGQPSPIQKSGNLVDPCGSGRGLLTLCGSCKQVLCRPLHECARGWREGGRSVELASWLDLMHVQINQAISINKCTNKCTNIKEVNRRSTTTATGRSTSTTPSTRCTETRSRNFNKRTRTACTQPLPSPRTCERT